MVQAVGPRISRVQVLVLYLSSCVALASLAPSLVLILQIFKCG